MDIFVSITQTIVWLAQTPIILQFLAAVFVIVSVMAIPQHSEKIRPFVNLRKYGFPAALIALSPMVLIALYQAFFLISPSHAAWENDKRGYAVLIAAIIGAPFIIWRTWIAQQVSKVTEQGHMTDRISKAVEQLGAEKTVWRHGEQSSEPNLEVRLGAIYALERIAQDSLRDHISVMEILCAYVRNNAPASGAIKIEIDTSLLGWGNDLEQKIYDIPTPRIDIQAALDVICRRKKEHIEFELDFESNPTSREYELDLRDTNLQKLNLTSARLANAKFSGARLQGANFSLADLQGSNLTDVQAQITNFKGAKLQHSDFRYATMQLAKFFDAKMCSSSLINTDISGASFYKAKMNDVRFTWAQAKGAKFRKTTLDQAYFFRTELQCSDFRGAKLNNADFAAADTRVMAVVGTSLENALNIKQSQLEEMFGDHSTNVPPNLKCPEWGSKFVHDEEFHTDFRSAKIKANLL